MFEDEKRVVSDNVRVNREMFNNSDLYLDTQDIVSELDAQRLADIALEMKRKNKREALENQIRVLDQHSICTGNVTCPKDVPERACDVACSKKNEPQPQPVVIHGEDCHCSKCCPNPNPNFFQRNKTKILLGIMWVAILILALGIAPGGAWYQALNASFVDLMVNVFKMGLLAVSGIVTYHLLSKEKAKKEKDE